MNTIIYVIQATGTDYFKVGYTSDIDKRLQTLQIGCPHKLKIIATLDAGEYTETTEKFIHTLLRPYRVRGEWFQLIEYVELDEDDSILLKIKSLIDEGRSNNFILNEIWGHAGGSSFQHRSRLINTIRSSQE